MTPLIRVSASLLASGVLIVAGAGVAAAATNPSITGQPSQTCGDPTAMTSPGNAISAPGSAFNPDGRSGSVYAGQQPQNSVNPKANSQYDVACFQVSQSH